MTDKEPASMLLLLTLGLQGEIWELKLTLEEEEHLPCPEALDPREGHSGLKPVRAGGRAGLGSPSLKQVGWPEASRFTFLKSPLSS